MALNSSNVRVAVTGVVSVGPTTAAAPTNATTALVGFSDLGYVSEDGVTETRGRSTNTIKAWQNADIVREVVTEANLTFHFTLLETNAATLELYYGLAVGTGGALVVVPSATGGRKAFNLDVVDGDDFIRTYIASGEVTETGDIVYASGEPIGYEVTVRAYPAPSIVDGSGRVGSAKKWYSSLSATP